MILLTCRKLRCLSACQKYTFLLSGDITFLRTLQFDWPTAFWSITRDPEFCQIWDWWWNICNNISFHFRSFPGKTNDKIFQQIQNRWALFTQIMGKNEFYWNFFPGSISFYKFQFSTIVQKPEKTNNPIQKKMPNWHFIRPSVGRDPKSKQASWIFWDFQIIINMKYHNRSFSTLFISPTLNELFLC